MTPYVSGGWDAAILVPGHIHVVPEEIKDILDKAWVEYDRSPYFVREADDLDPPPPDWKDKMSNYVNRLKGVA